MIDIGPGGREYRWLKHPAIFHGAVSSIHAVDRSKERTVHVEADELRDRINRGIQMRIAKVESVVYFAHSDINVEPLNRLVGGVINRVRMSHSIRNTGRAQIGRASCRERV